MKSNKTFPLIIAAAVLIKIFLFAFSTFNAPEHRIDPDSVGYLNIASQLSSRGVFEESNADGSVVPGVLRTPGYPLFLAGLHGLAKLPLAGVVFIQILLTLLATWIVSKMATRIDPATTLLSSFIMLYDPTITVVSLRILTESLYLFFMTSFLFVFIDYLKSGKIRPLLAAALLLVTATFVRPISYYLGAVLVAFMLYANPCQSRKRVALHALIFFVIVYGLLGLWQIRNYRCCGESDFASIARSNFSGYGLLHQYFSWDKPSLAQNIAAVFHGIFEAAQAFFSFLFCSVSFKYFDWRPLQIAGRILSYAWLVFWFPGFVAGIYKTRRNVLCQFLLLFILYFAGATVLNLSSLLEPRLKIPIVPCLAIFSAYGWLFLWPRIKDWFETRRAQKSLAKKTR